MKSITLKNGQIIEEYARKEMLDYIAENVESEFIQDGSLYIEYNDGSYYILMEDGDVTGRFKKTGIKCIIESNAACYCVYGKYRLEKVDESDSDEDCVWNVGPA